MKINNWHNFDPGSVFEAADLYRNICESLIDEGQLEIERKTGDFTPYYRWKIKSVCNKITIQSAAGQTFRISLEDVKQE